MKPVPELDIESSLAGASATCPSNCRHPRRANRLAAHATPGAAPARSRRTGRAEFDSEESDSLATEVVQEIECLTMLLPK